MILSKAGLAALAVVFSLSLGAPPLVRAQDQTTTTRDQATTTTTESHTSYDSPGWVAPRGYDEAYPEHGTPNMVARQGYAAGFDEGQAARARGKKFSPTDTKAYQKAIIPKGVNKDEFRQQFREAFVKGYTNGYKQQS